ncbi:MAG: hypothetical protein HPY76_05260 [Anaerolineae bacterium]|nr:hypothetical protein [Anaerolineae bacterium]
MKRLNRISLPYWTTPIALLVLCWFSFGLLAPQLGFYWDDWAKMLVGKIFGLSGYWQYYAEDRPLSGWTHILLTPLLGYKPLNWQLFVLALRWLTSVGVWWLLTMLFPARPRLGVTATLIFAVYPVFAQQSIAVTFHQQWLQYCLFVLSLILTVLAFRRPRWDWLFTTLALVAMLAQLSITEYFVGIELLRPLILWFLLAGVAPPRQRLWRWFRRYLPYFVLLAIYVVWRLFFIQLTGDDPYRAEMLYAFLQAPLGTVVSLLKTVFVDSFYLMVTQWAAPLDIGIELAIPPSATFAWGAGAAVALVLLLYLLALRDRDAPAQPDDRRWLVQILLLGALGVLAGCLPAWITGRRLIEDFHANRYALPAMLGASLLWAGLLEWAVRPRLPKAVILTGLIALSLVFHLRTADEYRQIWQSQRDFFWQLSWRAPMLQPGTAVLSEEELFPNQGGFSTSAALNLLYPQPEGWHHLAYWYYGMQPRFQDSAANPIGIPLRTQFRTLTFEGETPASILVYYEPQRANCLWLLDESDSADPLLPALTRQMLPASDLARILPASAPEGYPSADLYGEEPAHDWCYFYQKAALARQRGDWVTVVTLGDTARKERGYHPADAYFKTPHEWQVFIEGYARQGDWNTAAELLLAADGIDTQDYLPSLCAFWQQLQAETPASPQKEAAAALVSEGMTCDP